MADLSLDGEPSFDKAAARCEPWVEIV